MSDILEIVDFDECSVKPALLAGGGVAFVLTLNPLSVLLLFLAGFVATSTFIFKHQVRLELKHGMKVGIMACLVGVGASTVVYDILWVLFDYRIGMEFNLELLAQFMEPLPDGGGETIQDQLDKVGEEQFGFGPIIQQLMSLFVTSGIGGAVGGALATAVFKKGRLAQ